MPSFLSNARLVTSSFDAIAANGPPLTKHRTRAFLRATNPTVSGPRNPMLPLTHTDRASKDCTSSRSLHPRASRFTVSPNHAFEAPRGPSIGVDPIPIGHKGGIIEVHKAAC
ncbi:hypothetical protein KM043_005678 [Ampulex compressa]|nr:hypothetical protein KM043_005678 [Ampulex compressa]